MKDYNNISEEYLDKIISVAYGDAGIIDRIKVYYDSLRNNKIKELLTEYMATAKDVHSIKEETYVGNIPEVKLNLFKGLIFSLGIFLKRPVLSSAFILLIVGSVTAFWLTEKSIKYNGYTKSEITLAEMQAKESFAIVVEIFNRTSNKMKEDVLNKKLNDPIKRSFNIFNNYLIGG